MGRYEIRELTPRAWSIAFISILLIMAALFLVISRFAQPFPPKTIVMTTSMTNFSS